MYESLAINPNGEIMAGKIIQVSVGLDIEELEKFDRLKGDKTRNALVREWMREFNKREQLKLEKK